MAASFSSAAAVEEMRAALYQDREELAVPGGITITATDFIDPAYTAVADAIRNGQTTWNETLEGLEDRVDAAPNPNVAMARFLLEHADREM